MMRSSSAAITIGAELVNKSLFVSVSKRTAFCCLGILNMLMSDFAKLQRRDSTGVLKVVKAIVLVKTLKCSGSDEVSVVGERVSAVFHPSI